MDSLDRSNGLLNTVASSKDEVLFEYLQLVLKEKLLGMIVFT